MSLPNRRMQLPKRRAPWTAADRLDVASSQVIRGRWADVGDATHAVA